MTIYLVVTTDAGAARTAVALREAMVLDVPGWQPSYGVRGADSFSDALGDLEFGGQEGIAFAFLRFDDFARRQPVDAFHLLDSIERGARWHLLFGHRLLGLVQSDDPGFTTQPLGAVSATWNPREWPNSKRSLTEGSEQPRS